MLQWVCSLVDHRRRHNCRENIFSTLNYRPMGNFFNLSTFMSSVTRHTAKLPEQGDSTSDTTSSLAKQIFKSLVDNTG